MASKYQCVCFTGHRPEKLNESEEVIKYKIKNEIKRAIDDGYSVFISGMARGVDIIAAETVLELRACYHNIQLVCAEPYEFFGKDQGWKWNVRYKKVIARADKVLVVNFKRTPDCYMKRNKWMVDHSDRVIAVYNGSSGGTKNTIEYAKSKDVDIDLIKVSEPIQKVSNM